MSGEKYAAGVKECRATYWTPNRMPRDSDILACFKFTPQAGVDREEIAAAVVTSGDEKQMRFND